MEDEAEKCDDDDKCMGFLEKVEGEEVVGIVVMGEEDWVVVIVGGSILQL